MTLNHTPEHHTSDADATLAALLDNWQVPPPSPWLASRVASRVLASGAVRAFWPVTLKLRVAALAFAVVVGWGVGVMVSAPEASADSVELADLLW
jgi:hypothetical protein